MTPLFLHATTAQAGQTIEYLGPIHRAAKAGTCPRSPCFRQPTCQPLPITPDRSWRLRSLLGLSVFDGNNRLFVAEMRTYMQDIDGKNQHDRVSRVSMHVDTDGDGTFDRQTVFIENLLLPRMILPLDDRLIVGETDSNDLHVHRDTDGDGVADSKEPFYIDGRRGGNLEHQPSGLIWSIDNWLYTTYNAHRQRPPTALHADWCPQGTDRPERRTVGRGAGQLRQAMVRQRRRRAWFRTQIPASLMTVCHEESHAVLLRAL